MSLNTANIKMLRMSHAGQPNIEVYHSRARKPEGTVLTIGGFTCTMDRMWSRFASQLEDRYDIICYNSRGIGKSEMGKGITPANYIETDALDVLSILHQLQPRRSLHYVGHSKGALTMAMMDRIAVEMDVGCPPPKTTTYVTPLLDSPERILPEGNLWLNTASFVAKLCYRAITARANRQGLYEQALSSKDIRMADLAMRITIAIFQATTPAILSILGAEPSGKEAFRDFLHDAAATDATARVIQFLACNYTGPEIRDYLESGKARKPERVYALFANDDFDLLVNNRKAERILRKAFGNVLISRGSISGHFPQVEIPIAFASSYRDFLGAR